MYIIIYDFGTSSLKACLFDVGEEIRVIATANEAYGRRILENGGAEQDTEEWWQAICKTTGELFAKTEVRPGEVSGLAFCAQMQGVVLVDERGRAVRPAMSYLDGRGVREFGNCMGKGIIKVSGCSLYKLLRNLRVNYAGSTSAKDPVWKYKWVENNEPEVFARVGKWLDVGDYLVSRCTGRIIRTADSAFATFLYDTRRGREGWNQGLLKMYGVRPEHLPPIIDCTDLAGGLTAEAARDLGLKEGTPVFGGGGDTTFVNIGAGCVTPGDTHIYVGTSGWVSTFLDYQTVDIKAMITGVLSAIPGHFNYYAELETAGKCYEWVKNHLALDEINVYLKGTEITDGFESEFMSLYDYMSAEAGKVPPGSNGVIFTPWLHGNRWDVFQHPDRHRQAGSDPRRPRGDLLSSALAARMRSKKGEDVRYDPVRGRRSALARHLPDACRYHRKKDRDGEQRAGGRRHGRGDRGSGGTDGRGCERHRQAPCENKGRLPARRKASRDLRSQLRGVQKTV